MLLDAIQIGLLLAQLFVSEKIINFGLNSYNSQKMSKKATNQGPPKILQPPESITITRMSTQW